MHSTTATADVIMSNDTVTLSRGSLSDKSPGVNTVALVLGAYDGVEEGPTDRRASTLSHVCVQQVIKPLTYCCGPDKDKDLRSCSLKTTTNNRIFNLNHSQQSSLGCNVDQVNSLIVSDSNQIPMRKILPVECISKSKFFLNSIVHSNSDHQDISISTNCMPLMNQNEFYLCKPPHHQGTACLVPSHQITTPQIMPPTSLTLIRGDLIPPPSYKVQIKVPSSASCSQYPVSALGPQERCNEVAIVIGEASKEAGQVSVAGISEHGTSVTKGFPLPKKNPDSDNVPSFITSGANNKIDSALCSESGKNEDIGMPRRKKSISCKVCGKVFNSRWGFTTHMRSHRQDKPFSCDSCTYRCVTSSALVRHSRRHSGDKPYSCAQCHKSFRTSNALRLHKKLHSGERSHRCELCDKKFVQKSGLDYHMETHQSMFSESFEHSASCAPSKQSLLSSRPITLDSTMVNFHKKIELRRCRDRKRSCWSGYSCLFCFAIFRSDRLRDDHVRKSHADRLYQCRLCSFATSSKLRLENHSIEIHIDSKSSFSCQLCHLSFDSYAQKELHVPLHFVPNRTPSLECYGSYDLLAHYSDEDCGPQLDKPCSVGGIGYSKVYNNGGAPPTCNVCNHKSANLRCLRIHMKTHERKQALKCPVCPKEFWQKNKMLKHMLDHEQCGERHACRHCGTLFPSDVRKLKHMSKCGLSDPWRKAYECPECGHTLPSHMALVHHVRLVHHAPWPFRCLVCGRRFDTIASIQDHEQNEHQKLTYNLSDFKGETIEIGNQSFLLLSAKDLIQLTSSTRGSLDNLWSVPNPSREPNSGSVVATKKSLRCCICDKEFSCPVSFKSHWKNCSFNTDFSFLFGIDATDHDFVCSWCNETFPAMSALVRHEVYVHLRCARTIFSCRSCGRLFSSGQCCFEHYLSAHRDEWGTDIYGKGMICSTNSRPANSATDGPEFMAKEIDGVEPRTENEGCVNEGGAVYYKFYSVRRKKQGNQICESQVMFSGSLTRLETNEIQHTLSSTDDLMPRGRTITKLHVRRKKWEISR